MQPDPREVRLAELRVQLDSMAASLGPAPRVDPMDALKKAVESREAYDTERAKLVSAARAGDRVRRSEALRVRRLQLRAILQDVECRHAVHDSLDGL